MVVPSIAMGMLEYDWEAGDSESFRIRMYCSEHDYEKVSGEDHPTAGRSAASYRYSSKTPVFG